MILYKNHLPSTYMKMIEYELSVLPLRVDNYKSLIDTLEKLEGMLISPMLGVKLEEKVRGLRTKLMFKSHDHPVGEQFGCVGLRVYFIGLAMESVVLRLGVTKKVGTKWGAYNHEMFYTLNPQFLNMRGWEEELKNHLYAFGQQCDEYCRLLNQIEKVRGKFNHPVLQEIYKLPYVV